MLKTESCDEMGCMVDPEHSPEDEHALLQENDGLQRVTAKSISVTRLLAYGAVAQAALIMTYSCVFWIALHRAINLGDKSENRGLLPLPARVAVQPVIKPFKTDIVNSPFAGEPRHELDQAWHDLLQNDNIQIPTGDLDKLNLKSIPVKNTDNVIVSLGSFHALHCLKKTRQLVYRDVYHENKDPRSMRREFRHVDHCIEYLREYIMCHPDLSLITFHWINETSRFAPEVLMPTTWDLGPHECASWEALDGWAGGAVL